MDGNNESNEMAEEEMQNEEKEAQPEVWGESRRDS